jgi:hypothetical protein
MTELKLADDILDAELRVRKFTFDGSNSLRARHDLEKIMTALRATSTALQFYASEWDFSGEGVCEPTAELFVDKGRLAREALRTLQHGESK